MATKVVTTFDSSSPREETGEAEKVEQQHDFVQVLEALVHSHEVGENVFARCAKRAFRALLDDGIRLRMPGEVQDHWPIWVLSSSITLPISSDDDIDSTASFVLKDLVEQSAQFVNRIRRDKKSLLLIGALSTKIVEVGPKVYTFSVKQRWGLDD